MCGIAGILNLKETQQIELETLAQMLATMRHRGPDGVGMYRDGWVGLGNARLSIIDLSSGDQPIGNEDGTLWIVLNGEIFNYVELRPDLEKRGHRFTTNSDTEVILHLYEEYGTDCLQFLNGQFSFAIWDERRRSLFLARDRMGITPLYYTVNANRLIFGSEMKAILAHPDVHAEIDQQALREVFTYWGPLTPHSIFKDIFHLPPAHYMLVENGEIVQKRYWSHNFSVDTSQRSVESYQEELESLLIDATRIRLRADVPVGAYLSGGLDSSLTTAIIRKHTQNHLDTFSITFSDPAFDESQYQLQMAQYLGTDHHVVSCTYKEIGEALPDVIWHTETPVLRTAPVPMYLLSRLVREHQFKVVITGEGSDEFLAGYDIFKEMKIRRFWARDPESKIRPRLLSRLYPDISGFGASSAFLTAFFKNNLTSTGSPYYSHLIRWKNTARTQRFLRNPSVDPQLSEEFKPLELPPEFEAWPPLGQAQFLEIATFFAPYLISSQGDRMVMANSVEGRFPFLDHRVDEFCNRLPPELKMPVLHEKWLLKQVGKKYLPEAIRRRVKKPYRAPIHRSFFDPQPLDFVTDLLSEDVVQKKGLFEPQAVTRLKQKALTGANLSEVEDMALVGILSAQLVHELFVGKKHDVRPRQSLAQPKIIDHIHVR
jgi:asparagine synthase (glutamine-hydrolysing)